MDQANVTIEQIFGTDRFQKFQDDLSSSIGLAMIMVNYLGRPITKHSGRIAFCDIIRSDSQYKELCEKCDSRGGLEAMRSQTPYIYLCHANLVDVAIPIMMNNSYLGAWMVGEASLVNREDEENLEKIYSRKIKYKEDLFPRKEFKNVPKISLERMTAIAKSLFKISKLQIAEYLLNHMDEEEGFPSIENDIEEEGANCKNFVNIALDYIDEHLYENTSLTKIAEFCNVSPGYFSHVFSKQMNETFSSYVNRIKINHAMELLEKTDMSVNEVADRLGYNDNSYFIKKFKLITGSTPKSYRNK